MEPACVGALIRDDRGRVFVQRRSPDRPLLPGVWDLAGGHIDPGETAEEALAREVFEETGWTVRTIGEVVADWTWEADGSTRRELDYLVEVDGDLDDPQLEWAKHDRWMWVGPDDLATLLDNREPWECHLHDIIAAVVLDDA